MSRCGDFHGDDKQTNYFTPAHARGVIKLTINKSVKSKDGTFEYRHSFENSKYMES